MARPDHDPGIEHEPFMRGPVPPEAGSGDHAIYDEPALGGAPPGAPSAVEVNVPCPRCGYNRRGLTPGTRCPECGYEPVGTIADPDASVFDEPAMNAASPAEEVVIDRDWSCAECGHNLRGCRVGDRCPACQQRITTRPANLDHPGYASWLQSKVDTTAESTTWLTVWGMMLVGGVWAVISTFLSFESGSGVLGAVLFGPVVEEIMKISLVAMVIETRPYLLRHASQVVLAAVASGLGFAVIENILYLTVYVDSPTAGLIAWRWTVCTALHVGCTAIASLGAMAMWRRTVRERRPPTVAPMLPMLVVAMVIHGSYNMLALLMGVAGIDFS